MKTTIIVGFVLASTILGASGAVAGLAPEELAALAGAVTAVGSAILGIRDRLSKRVARRVAVPPTSAPRVPAAHPYRAAPSEVMVDESLAVAREVLRRGAVAHVLVTEAGALVQAYDPADGRTVLGAVSLPEVPGYGVADFLARLDAKVHI